MTRLLSWPEDIGSAAQWCQYDIPRGATVVLPHGGHVRCLPAFVIREGRPPVRHAITGLMAIAAIALLGVALLFVLLGAVIDARNSFAGIYFAMSIPAFIGAVVVGLVGRGIWRDRRWAWIVLGIIGAAIGLIAWQINQSYYGDGSLLALTPITPYLAPIALAGVLLIGAAIRRGLRGRDLAGVDEAAA
ncbi:MAG TPA: hypothetical protein VF071_08710 [Candidatus Limnocylindria bacterium]